MSADKIFGLSGIADSYYQQATTGLDLEGKKTELFADALKKAQEGYLQNDGTIDATEQAENDEKLMRACKEFESYFLNLMFKEMRKSVKSVEGFIPKSFAEETFTEMLDTEYTNRATEAGGIGLAKHMFEQMSQRNKVIIKPGTLDNYGYANIANFNLDDSENTEE